MTEATGEDVERRRRALDECFGRFDAVARRMKDVYGLRLPRHVAVWAALWRSLSPLEQQGLSDFGGLGFGRENILIWFEDGGLERKTRDGLDPRLEMRFRSDPPEFVTLMSGNTDGLHHGLWYDDPAELPSFIAYNYARDSAETWEGEATIVRVIAERARKNIEEPDYPEEPIRDEIRAIAAAVDWFKDADEKALAEDGPRRWADAERGKIVGSLAPVLPPEAGRSRATEAGVNERGPAYQRKKASTDLLVWIEDARSELRHGKPAFALVLGRELHWLAVGKYQTVALELLCGAYEALGRHALAEIAKVHHAHRDLQSVDVYERA